MGTAMATEVGAIREPSPANIAAIRLGLAVGGHVRLQLALAGEALSTMTSILILMLSRLSRVGLPVKVTMLGELVVRGEKLPTFVALRVIGMYKPNVLFQHCFVLKWCVAKFTSNVPVCISDVHGYLPQ